MWRLGLERPLIPTSSLIIPSAPATRNRRTDMLVSSSASYSVTHLGWETFEENGAPVLVCQRAACGSLTYCREMWRRISLHAVEVWKIHMPSPQVMQLDQTPRELLWLSNLGCIFEVNDRIKKIHCKPFLKVGMTFLLSLQCSAFPKRINIQVEKYKMWIITSYILLSFDILQEKARMFLLHITLPLLSTLEGFLVLNIVMKMLSTVCRAVSFEEKDTKMILRHQNTAR